MFIYRSITHREYFIIYTRDKHDNFYYFEIITNKDASCDVIFNIITIFITANVTALFSRNAADR